MGDMNFTGSPLAIAVTAAVFSPRVRQVLHRGAVHGLAGVLIAGDAVTSFARGVGRGLQEASTAAPGQDTAEQPAGSATETAQDAAAAAKPPKARKTAAKPKATRKTGGSQS